jgi:hypothetical protein
MSEEQKDFNEAVMAEMLTKLIALRIEERITGNRKVMLQKQDFGMPLGYGLANDDSDSRISESHTCFRHARFRDKFQSAVERREAIDKFIAGVEGYGDTILWREKPKLWEERLFTHDQVEYWASFRFSVWYSSPKDT